MALSRELAPCPCCPLSWGSDQGLSLHVCPGLRLALTLSSTWDPVLTSQVNSVQDSGYSQSCTSQHKHVFSQPLYLIISLARLTAPGSQAHVHLASCSACGLQWTPHK